MIKQKQYNVEKIDSLTCPLELIRPLKYIKSMIKKIENCLEIWLIFLNFIVLAFATLLVWKLVVESTQIIIIIGCHLPDNTLHKTQSLRRIYMAHSQNRLYTTENSKGFQKKIKCEKFLKLDIKKMKSTQNRS